MHNPSLQIEPADPGVGNFVAPETCVKSTVENERQRVVFTVCEDPLDYIFLEPVLPADGRRHRHVEIRNDVSPNQFVIYEVRQERLESPGLRVEGVLADPDSFPVR